MARVNLSTRQLVRTVGDIRNLVINAVAEEIKSAPQFASYDSINYPKKIGYVSDIHAESKRGALTNPIIKPRGIDYLALCGDIGDPTSLFYKTLLKNASDNFEETFVVAGNHEYYSDKYTFHEINKIIDEECDQYSNVHFMDKRSKVVGNKFLVAGCTLWTNRSNNRYGEDNNKIRYKDNFITSSNISNLHLHHSKYIKKIIEKDTHLKKIILTHHVPSRLLMENRFQNYAKQSLFYNDMDWIFNMEGAPECWLCGHTHSRLFKYIGRTYCGINAHICKKYRNGYDDGEIDLDIVEFDS
jgi:predicted phosphodiesterase